jgi:type IV secretion system protein VirB4
VVFITQSPGDIIESGLSRVLLEMCPTQFFLANPRGLEKDYREGFRLTAGEYEAFRRIQPRQGMFLLKQGDKSVVCQLPMRGEGMAEYVQILSAREADLRLVEEAA